MLLAGCDPLNLPGKPDPANRPITPEQVSEFKDLYAQNCSGCHGETGTLGPAPPLNDPLFRALISEEELLKVVRNGRPGTPMPAFLLANGGPLTESQIQLLVYQIKGTRYELEERPPGVRGTFAIAASSAGMPPEWGEPPTPPKEVPPYRADGPVLAGDKERGSAVFMMACAGCHGPRGEGTKTKDGDQKPGAINAPAFLTLISDQALRRIVITGRADLGMPDWSSPTGRDDEFHPLTSQQVADVVALLAHWRTGGTNEK